MEAIGWGFARFSSMNSGAIRSSTDNAVSLTIRLKGGDLSLLILVTGNIGIPSDYIAFGDVL